MYSHIKERIFLVGCPRSGTTLLQSLLAAHPQIASFPETHLVVVTGRTRRGRWCTRLGLVSPEMRRQFERFLEVIGQLQMKALLPKRPILIGRYIAAVVRVLDTITLDQGKLVWLEKSPTHLHYLSLLERYVPNAKFIHLLRNGADVVASLYQVTQQYADAWGGACDIDQCIARWNQDILLSLRYRDRANHMLVYYEQLVENPTVILTDICRFIGVSTGPNLVGPHRQVAQSIILADEPWKQKVLQPIGSTNGTKFAQLFTAEQRAYVLERLTALDLPDWQGHGKENQ